MCPSGQLSVIAQWFMCVYFSSRGHCIINKVLWQIAWTALGAVFIKKEKKVLIFGFLIVFLLPPFLSQHEIEIHSIYFFNTHSLSYSESFVFIIFYQNVKTPVTCKNHKALFSVLPCTVHFLKFSQFLTDKIKSHPTVLFLFCFLLNIWYYMYYITEKKWVACGISCWL